MPFCTSAAAAVQSPATAVRPAKTWGPAPTLNPTPAMRSFSPTFNWQHPCCGPAACAAHRQRQQRQHPLHWHAPMATWHSRQGVCLTAALPPSLETLLTPASSGPSPATLLEGMQAALAQHAGLYTLELLFASTAAYAAAVWPNRPRGWCFKELVEVRPSSVAGKGVFASVHIAAGVVLGAYPGRPRTPQQMAAKCAVAPRARDYCFRTRAGLLLDPTDEQGLLSTAPGPGLPWLPTDVTLAYVNEPPRGVGGTNVTVEDDPDDGCGLLCVAARDIALGEELFMDYGVHYDRSGYAGREEVTAAGNGSSSSSSGRGGDGRQGEQLDMQRALHCRQAAAAPAEERMDGRGNINLCMMQWAVGATH